MSIEEPSAQRICRLHPSEVKANISKESAPDKLSTLHETLGIPIEEARWTGSMFGCVGIGEEPMPIEESISIYLTHFYTTIGKALEDAGLDERGDEKLHQYVSRLIKEYGMKYILGHIDEEVIADALLLPYESGSLRSVNGVTAYIPGGYYWGANKGFRTFQEQIRFVHHQLVALNPEVLVDPSIGMGEQTVGSIEALGASKGDEPRLKAVVSAAHTPIQAFAGALAIKQAIPEGMWWDVNLLDFGNDEDWLRFDAMLKKAISDRSIQEIGDTHVLLTGNTLELSKVKTAAVIGTGFLMAKPWYLGISKRENLHRSNTSKHALLGFIFRSGATIIRYISNTLGIDGLVTAHLKYRGAGGNSTMAVHLPCQSQVANGLLLDRIAKLSRVNYGLKTPQPEESVFDEV